MGSPRRAHGRPPRDPAAGRGLPKTGGTSYPPEWELFDLDEDPLGLTSVHLDPACAGLRREPTLRLRDLPQEPGDSPHPRQPVPEGRTR